MKKYIVILFFLAFLAVPRESKALYAGPACLSTCTPYEISQAWYVFQGFSLYPNDGSGVTATTTLPHGLIGLCGANFGGKPTGLFYFDRYGGRLNENYFDSVGNDFSCFIPQTFDYYLASTTSYDVYYNSPDTIVDNSCNKLSSCLATQPFLTYVKTYQWDSLKKNLAFNDGAGRSGIASPVYDPQVDSQLAAVGFMYPLFKYIMGSGFGVLKELLPYIIGTLVIFSLMGYIIYGLNRFKK